MLSSIGPHLVSIEVVCESLQQNEDIVQKSKSGVDLRAEAKGAKAELKYIRAEASRILVEPKLQNV